MRVAPPGGWGGEWLGAPPGLLSEGRGRYRGATKRRDQDLQSCAARSGSHVDISSPEIRLAAAAGQAWGRGDTAAVARLSGSATPACCRAHGGPLGAANDWQSARGASRASGGATGGRVVRVYTNSPALRRSQIRSVQSWSRPRPLADSPARPRGSRPTGNGRTHPLLVRRRAVALLGQVRPEALSHATSLPPARSVPPPLACRVALWPPPPHRLPPPPPRALLP